MTGSLLTLEPFVSHRAYTLWRLEPHKTDATKPPIKVPVHYDGATHHSKANPAPLMTAAEALGWLSHHRAAGNGHARVGEVGYLGAGFRPAGTGLVCVDLDDCITAEGWTPGAATLMQQLAGGLIEQSVSARGAHIWVTVQGAGPGRCGKRTTPHGAIEVYGDGQFIAMGTVLGGDARVDHTDAITRIVAEHWPPLPEASGEVSAVDWSSKTPAQQAATLADVRSALATLDADNRDEWIAAGQALRSLGDTGYALWVEWSATSSRFPGGDGLDKWETLSGERTDYRAVIAKAQRNGWVNPSAGARLPSNPAALFAPGAAAPAGMLLERPAPVPGMAVVGTEDALADEFVQRHGTDYRVTPGMGWMRRTGPTFEPDNKLRRYDQTRHLCRLASATSTGANRLGSAKTVNGVLTLAQSDPRIVVGIEAWDSDPYALNTPEGVVDLRTGETRPHVAGDLFTQVTRVTPIAAPCPTWATFLQTVFMDAELIAFMQRSMGYWLTGDRSAQVVHFLYGLGANGKSVLIDFIQFVLGPYATKMPAAALMQRRGERHPTELAMLRGKRLAVSSELPEGEHMNEPLIKELTGDTTVAARLMRQDYFQFEMTQKHVLVGNHKPRLYGGDEAMARRLLLVGFHATFKGAARDPAILEKLKAEAPAVLHWMVQGAVQWHADGGGLAGLRVPAAVAADSAEYMSANDDVAGWVAERCEREGSVKAATAYSDFRMWKTARGETPQSIVRWSERLLRITGITREKSSSVFYRGLTVKAPGMFTV